MVYYTERIKEIRQQKNLSQKDMGELLEMHQTQYGRYEIGKNAMTVELFRKICVALNTSPEYLLGFTDEKRPLK